MTSKEMSYLRKHCKELYEEALKIQRKRKAFEEKVEHCQTKQEVLDALIFEIGHIPECEENKEALMNCYQDVVKEFEKTSKYNNFPNKGKNEDENKDTVLEYFFIPRKILTAKLRKKYMTNAQIKKLI